MIDETHTWFIIEDENDKKFEEEIRNYIKQKVGNENVYNSLKITYLELRPFLLYPFDVIQLGFIKDSNYTEIAGIMEINGAIYKREDFTAETTLDAGLLKKFFKKLTENIKMRYNTVINIRFYKDLPVWVEVEGRTGAIAPKVSDY
jgi:hypothetical protein